MKIAIIGLGLIGASLSRALIEKTDHEVLGSDVDEKVIKIADESGAYSRALIEKDIADIDLVIFALCPEDAIREMKRICPKLKNGAIVADVCGNKRLILDEMLSLKKKYPFLRFVGTHPMAGKERGGILNASANLFKDAYAIIVPTDDSDAVEIIKTLYLSIGVKDVKICSAQKHDEMIAYTSQLAHIVSNCYVQNPLSKGHIGFSAGSFADLTRVARLDPDMWSQLFFQNKDNLICCIDDIVARLVAMKNALKNFDVRGLKDMLAYGVECKKFADGEKEDTR